MTQKQTTQSSGMGRVVRMSVLGVVFTAVVVVLLLLLAGVFHRKIDTDAPTTPPVAGRPVEANTTLIPATVFRTPIVESAVGTVRAVHETAIASKLLAKVVKVNVQAGKEVRAGDVLVQLDDEDLQAQVRQTDAAITAQQAVCENARTAYQRVKPLYEQGIEAKTEFDRVDAELKVARAELERLQQVRGQARTVLEYATIRSPIDGKVIEKHIEEGDTASPGQALLTLYDPARMQLVASVRESLTQRLEVGQEIGVRIDALDKTCAGQVSEIVPAAEAASRTFLVKVTGPCPVGVYSGMFGRLLIPLDEQEVTVIPHDAVRRIGQLDIVNVAEKTELGDMLRRRIVQLGRTFGDQVEVLSGLHAGERVALSEGG